jgi:hypothetical protein
MIPAWMRPRNVSKTSEEAGFLAGAAFAAPHPRIARLGTSPVVT